MSEPECTRLPEVGAYLLGALSPAERAGYAGHLQRCQQCLREVAQLAGLPGLLARGSGLPAAGAGLSAAGPGGAARAAVNSPAWPGAFADLDPSVPADPDRVRQDDPMTGALRAVHRAQWRRRVLVAVGFLLVAGVALVGPALAAGLTRPITGVTAAVELPVRMQPVGNAPVSAALALTQRPWGTEVVMRCRYDGPARSPVYVLVARAVDGTSSELARWSAVTDQDVVLAAATDIARPRLAELEVRNAAGAVVLRAQQ